jgi:hypothetical protein
LWRWSVADAVSAEYAGLGSIIDITIVAKELARKFRFVHRLQQLYFAFKLLREAKSSVVFGFQRSCQGREDVGFDVGAGGIRWARCTRLRRSGDDWLINGQKLWATGAGAENRVINVYARTDRNAHYKRNIANWSTTTLRCIAQARHTGAAWPNTYEIFFEDVRVPADRLVGENRGWECVLSGL